MARKAKQPKGKRMNPTGIQELDFDGPEWRDRENEIPESMLSKH